MGLANITALAVVLWNDQTGFTKVYLSTMLFFAGITITNELKGNKK